MWPGVAGRAEGSSGWDIGDETATLVGFLRWQRETLELKCAGLDREQLARRPLPQSNLSLLGLVRHLADVELGWFRSGLAREDVRRRFSNAEDPDGDFDGAAADPDVVAQAWAAWREEVAYADRFVAAAPDLSSVSVDDPYRGPLSLRFRARPHDRGVRAPPRARGPVAPADRRARRSVSKRQVGG